MGGVAAANIDIDYGKPALNAILQACDSLLGKRDDVEPQLANGPKGIEAFYQMWQHVCVSSIGRFIISEIAESGNGVHSKPALDAKAKSELRLTASIAKTYLDNYDDSDAATELDPATFHQGEIYTPTPTPQQSADAKTKAAIDRKADADKADADKKTALGDSAAKV